MAPLPISGRTRTNYAATTPPGATNDNTQGYTIGSVWLNTTTGVLWRAIAVTTNAAIWLPDTLTPGLIAGRYQSTYDGTTATATAVATLDTVAYFYPFTVDQKIAVTSLNTRSVTGAAGSAVKMALWANDYVTTHRPTGLAIAGSNTGQATTGSGVTATVAVSLTLYPRLVYWFGSAFTTLGPQMVSIANSVGLGWRALGRAAMANNTITGLSAPYTYATDIMALDLTSATFTDLSGAVGVPVMHLGT